jgi:integrase
MMLELQKPIGMKEVRILRPSEYELLRQGALDFNEGNAINLDGLLLTGMRYLEAVRFQDHPEWFDGNFVYLPKEAQLKEASKQRERWIRISPEKVGDLRLFLSNRKLPHAWSTWRENLARWALNVGLDPIWLSPKTTRKTYESWLAKCYPERMLEIAQRQGHTSSTQARYYLNLPFLPGDVEAMRPYTRGVF